MNKRGNNGKSKATQEEPAFGRPAPPTTGANVIPVPREAPKVHYPDKTPPKYGEGSRPCYVCGKEGHGWTICTDTRRYFKGCAVCSSTAHEPYQCAQRYRPRLQRPWTTPKTPHLYSLQAGVWRDTRESAPGNIKDNLKERWGGQLIREVQVEKEDKLAPLCDPQEAGQLLFPISLEDQPGTALLDSGASHSFVSQEWVKDRNLQTTPLHQPLSVGTFGGVCKEVSQVLKCSKVAFIGPPHPWNFLVLNGAPQDVVIGLDYSWTQGLYMDPRDTLLYKVPLPMGRKGRRQERAHLYAALPFPRPPCRSSWDSFDLLTCEDNHEHRGIRHTPSGFTLYNVTASGEDEEEQLRKFRASLPHDLLTVVDSHSKLFAPPDRIPPERSIKHYIHVSPTSIPVRSSPYNLSGSRLEAMKRANNGSCRQRMDTTLLITMGIPNSFCIQG